jgi:hypothetical protein
MSRATIAKLEEALGRETRGAELTRLIMVFVGMQKQSLDSGQDRWRPGGPTICSKSDPGS